MSDKVLGLDLNDYRKGVPLKTAKQQGARFVINKATQGTTILHATNEIYREESAKLGIPFGNYIYWKFAVNAVAQAEFYLKHMGKVQFPPIIDVERIGNVKTGTSTVPIVSQQANRNHLAIVWNTLLQETNIEPMIYTNYASWYYLFGNWDWIKDKPLWVANWRTSGEPYLPKPAFQYDIHQWTSTYQIAGYYRGVDANWFNGNEAEFEAYIAEYDKKWNPTPVEPPPPPPVEKETVVTLEIQSLDGVSMQLLQPGESLIVRVNEIE